jgi:hypothetical protein
MTLPLAPIAGLSCGLIGPVQSLISGNYPYAFGQLVANYTGFGGAETGNPAFNAQNLMNGAVPLIVGLLVHKFVGERPINANAALARAKIPLIRI